MKILEADYVETDDYGVKKCANCGKILKLRLPLDTQTKRNKWVCKDCSEEYFDKVIEGEGMTTEEIRQLKAEEKEEIKREERQEPTQGGERMKILGDYIE